MIEGLISRIEQLKLWSSCDLYTSNKRNQINTVFWFCLIFTVAFQLFSKLIQPYLRALNVDHYKWRLTIRHIWNICFYAVATVSLYLYQAYYLADNLYFKQNGQNYYRSYENLLFYTNNNRCSPYNFISLILLSFHIVSALYDLNERSFSQAINTFFVCGVVICFNSSRLEYYSVTFNILLGSFKLFTNCLRFICWHTPQHNVFLFRVCVAVKLFVWSYIFLNLLPFKYLMPTLNGRKFYLLLNVFLWFWYGSCVWNSPFLQYFYHQIYHVNRTATDCLGEISVSRCILIRETNELRHLKNLQKAFAEILLTERQDKKTENSSVKTYQTIKCVMALKRKLKRIRENKEHFA